MWLELLHFLFTLRYYKNSESCAKGYTENENKIIANLQFGDWYHLNTRWLTQKKKFIMSYVSMTIYNIYSFLFIIVINLDRRRLFVRLSVTPSRLKGATTGIHLYDKWLSFKSPGFLLEYWGSSV